MSSSNNKYICMCMSIYIYVIENIPTVCETLVSRGSNYGSANCGLLSSIVI